MATNEHERDTNRKRFEILVLIRVYSWLIVSPFPNFPIFPYLHSLLKSFSFRWVNSYYNSNISSHNCRGYTFPLLL